MKSDGELKNLLNNAHDSLYKKERRSPLNIVLNVIIAVFCVVLVMELLFNVFYTGIYVIDRSMYPTVIGATSPDSPDGEFIYVDKYAKPDYGDIVVVHRDGEGDNIIKRVVAFGGDKVEIISGVLFVNGKEIEEPYVDPDNNTHGDSYAEYRVEEGYIYLLGDNRDVSNDSRANGAYPVKNLLGVVPKWSLSLKSVTTGFYKFFKFTLWGK